MSKKSKPPKSAWRRLGLDHEDRTALLVMVQELRQSFLQLNILFEKFITDMDPCDSASQFVGRIGENSLLATALLVALAEKILGVTPRERGKWNEALKQGKPPVGIKDLHSQALIDMFKSFAEDALSTPTDEETEH